MTTLTASHAAHDTMTTEPQASRAGIWSGRVLSGLISLFLIVDAAAKLALPAVVVEASQKVGVHVDTIRPIGAALLLSTVLHLVPRTQIIGAALITAYLGGAVATHVHSGTPFFMPIAMGVLLWVAYALRNRGFRELVLSDLSGR